MTLKINSNRNAAHRIGFALLMCCCAGTSTAVLGLSNDSDGDQIVDTVDVDDDNDGITDILEISDDGRDIDSDKDGIPNRLDLDSDNDGILDWQESGVVISVDMSPLRVVAGRFVGEVGLNGLLDALESPVDGGQIIYSLVNTDAAQDAMPDFLDLDSDNDGLPDLHEAGVADQLDSDNDGRIDISGASAGADGISDRLQRINDQTCCDVNDDGIEDAIPRNSDNADFPDYQDLDSDNDGVFDLIEAGGSDLNNDGRIDNFFDSPNVDGFVDGMDDSILAIPLHRPDLNGNGVIDYADEFSQSAGNEPDGGNSILPADEPVETPIHGTDGVHENFDRNPAARPSADGLVNANQPAQDDPDGLSTGPVATGLSGSGCSIQSTGVDLLLALLAVLSLSIVGWRYTLRKLRR